MYLTCLICIYKFLCRYKERNKMINNIVNFLNSKYNAVNYYGYNNIDPNLVRYFKNEYGQDWQSALSEHLYKKKDSNDKKAA